MSITYLEAIREAQARALADDDRVFIYGQDVGAFGGAFKATKGLLKEFPGRVMDSPISEDAAVGLAIGAAIEGMRPIVEMQFADFSSVGFGQIINNAATLYWRTQVPCPVVVRLPSGGTSERRRPFHSQSMEAIYAHYPGLVVMTPATVEDAYSMLLEAVAIDDPVIFCEHKYLYYHLKADRLPTADDPPPLPTGRARVARAWAGRHGRDVQRDGSRGAQRGGRAGGGGHRDRGRGPAFRSSRWTRTPCWRASRARGGCSAVGEAFPWGGGDGGGRGARGRRKVFHLLDAPPQRLNALDTPRALPSPPVGSPPARSGRHCQGGARFAQILNHFSFARGGVSSFPPAVILSECNEAEGPSAAGGNAGCRAARGFELRSGCPPAGRSFDSVALRSG